MINSVLVVFMNWFGKEPSFVINGILFGSVINDISVIFTELYCAVCHRIQLPKIRFRDAENREYDHSKYGRMAQIPVYTLKTGSIFLIILANLRCRNGQGGII